MHRLVTLLSIALCAFTVRVPSPTSHGTAKPRFKVLALAEKGGHHIKYTQAARVWLDKLASNNNFSVDYIENSTPIDETFLEQYQVFVQLDFPPYTWSDQSKQAFERFMQRGKGGWIGFHHATLLGEFDGYSMWNWFSDFMGGIRWKNYIATFATAKVNVEDAKHPCMRGVPSSFTIENEEWYTYDRSPRERVHVIASVDESTYTPDSDIKMGDHPVIWTNEKMKTRNIYIFMGHSPDLFKNDVYRTLFENAIFWAADAKPVLK
ncbi:MAG TPA: ThuA domain-containing protein [Chryseolinea sp.]|nr:ThuA domain-containing protein [Chryseolinea sp.]